jgi:membrane-associated protein
VSGLELFLDSYGVAAACAIMLVKAAGIPIPIPGDFILLATAARAAEGKVLLWVAFVALLLALTVGGVVQFLLARGPARGLVLRYGHRLGLTEHRLDLVARHMRRGGVLGISVAVLTPGVRTAVIPACGLTGMPLRTFLPGLALGSAVDLGLHFGIGYVGAGLLSGLTPSSPLILVVLLAALGLGAWLIIARRRKAPVEVAISAWAQATCPVCLTLGTVASLQTEPAVRWSSVV